MPRRSRIPKPRFYLDDPLAKEPTGITMYYFYGEPNPLKYATGEEIHPKLWEQKTQRITAKDKSHEALELYLEKIKANAIEVFKENGYGQIKVDRFRFELDVKMGFKQKVAKEQMPFLDFMLETVNMKKASPDKNIRGTWKVIESWHTLLLEYAKTQEYIFDYQDINEVWFEGLKNWCFREKNHQKNYVHKGLTVIRQIMRAAEKRDFHGNKGYGLIKAEKVQTNKPVLYLDELEKIYADRPTGGKDLDVWINLFVGCFTGMRISDWRKVRKDLIKQVGNLKMIEVYTQKTGAPVAIPFLDVLENVLEFCNYEVPPVVDQVFNKYIKRIAAKSVTENMHWLSSFGGVEKREVVPKAEKISSHACRRSFASNFTLIGCPPSMLMPITGHASEKQFRQYVNIEGRQNAEAFARYGNLIKFDFNKR